MMSKTEFLALAEARYSELAALEQSQNFYEHEKNFDAIWVGLGQQVLEATIGEVPEQARKKKSFKAVMVKSK
jgi:uncharacterized membrane protein